MAVAAGGCGARGGSLAAAGGAPFTLKFNFDKGAKYTYDTTTKLSQTGAATMQLTETVTNTVEIEDKTDHGFKALTTFGDVKVDTGSSAGAAAASQTESLKGTTMETTYGSDGAVQNVEVKSNNPLMKAMGSALGGMNFGFMGLVCPSSAIHVGSTWNSTLDLGRVLGAAGMGGANGGNSTVPISFKLSSVAETGGKTIADIAIDVSGSAVLTVMGQSVTDKLSLKGELHVDAAKGLVLDYTLGGTQSMDLGGKGIDQRLDVTCKLRS